MMRMGLIPCRWLIVLGAGIALGGPAPAQVLYPGAGYPSAVGNATLVNILLSAVRPFERVEAARLLGASGDLKAITALSTAAVYDNNARVRQAASDAIIQIRRANQPRPPQPFFPTPPPPLPPPVLVDPYIELVTSWYMRFLNRQPDPAGLQNWVTLLRQGVSPEKLEWSILGSQEYFERKGGRPADFIRGLYIDVLGRLPATRQEMEYWLSKFREYNGDRARVAEDFLREAQPELASRPGGGLYPLQPPGP